MSDVVYPARRARVGAGLLGERVTRLSAALKSAARVARVVLGVPDYERYVRHMRARHPDAPPLTREEFERERQEARYSRPGTRCC